MAPAFAQLVKEGYAFFDKKHCASCLGCTPKAYNSTLRSVRSVFCDAHVAAENDLIYFFATAKKLCEAFSKVSGPECSAPGLIYFLSFKGFPRWNGVLFLIVLIGLDPLPFGLAPGLYLPVYRA